MLPEFDVLNKDFIEESKQYDCCSVSPDYVFAKQRLGDGIARYTQIYVGSACRAHDLRYDWIQENVKWWRFAQRKALYDGYPEDRCFL